jgi:hypothetical protein
MRTLTMTVDPASAPTGAVCRIYHEDDNAFIGETISDGSGTLVFDLDEHWAEEFNLNVYVNGVEGGSKPYVVSQAIT